jgi:hypothetical protein
VATYSVTIVQRVPAESTGPTLTELGPLAAALTYTDELDEAPQLELSADLMGVQSNIKDALRDLLGNPIEAWVYRDSTLVFAGPVVGGDVEDRVVNLTARGLEFYLAYMLVDTNKSFTSIDQYTIAVELVDEWQALTWGDYGIDTSGVGASGTTRTLAIPGATEPRMVYEEVKALGDLDGGFNWYVNPTTRALVLGTRGSDLSNGVFLERGVKSPNVQFAIGPGVIASDLHATGTGKATVTTTKANTSLRESFGRAGASVSIDGADTAALINAAAQAEIDKRASGYFAPGPGLVPVAGAGVADFGVGDTVTYSFDSGLGLQTGAFRIRKREVAVSMTGDETMSVEFV